MLDLVELSRSKDKKATNREISRITADISNTHAVYKTIFYPVYASPDDIDFQREESFEPQFLPR